MNGIPLVRNEFGFLEPASGYSWVNHMARRQQVEVDRHINPIPVRDDRAPVVAPSQPPALGSADK